MREPTFLILSVLAQGASHGYALLTETKKLSAGRVTLQPGTLYTALERLKEEGLVIVAREEIVDSRLRRYYELTDLGADELGGEIARLEANASAGRASLRIRSAQLAGGLA
ncbi:PadR family transcriptional regulator [Arthrobacter sp. NPDC056886]|uniref:PadR family transcriptional regulator n=1 Tax=Arthrobacter sp. NPDC056886 TaxID=3345960 RepID=UPI00366E022A